MFTAGQFWRDEYGSSERSRTSSRRLIAYSPYHNIKDGVEYPATLIMTADTDDRVVPMHSFKFAAALQRAQAGNAPILLADRKPRRPRQRHAGHQANRRSRRPLGVFGEEPRMDVPVEN